MRRAQGLSGAVLALALGLAAAGCGPQQNSAPDATPGAPTRSASPDAVKPAKIETATLKAAGMH